MALHQLDRAGRLYQPASSSLRDQSPHTTKTRHASTMTDLQVTHLSNRRASWNKVPKRNPISKAPPRYRLIAPFSRSRPAWLFSPPPPLSPRDRAVLATDRNMPKSPSIPRALKPKILCTGIRIRLLSISTPEGRIIQPGVSIQPQFGAFRTFGATSSPSITILSHAWFSSCIWSAFFFLGRAQSVSRFVFLLFLYPLFTVTFRRSLKVDV